MDSPHKRPVTRKMLPFDDVIMTPAWKRLACRFLVMFTSGLAFLRYNHHYCDVIWARWRIKSPASQLFTQSLIQAQRKHQRSASLTFVRGIHRWPVNSPHKLPVTRKMFPFDDVIMRAQSEIESPAAWRNPFLVFIMSVADILLVVLYCVVRKRISIIYVS